MGRALHVVLSSIYGLFCHLFTVSGSIFPPPSSLWLRFCGLASLLWRTTFTLSLAVEKHDTVQHRYMGRKNPGW